MPTTVNPRLLRTLQRKSRPPFDAQDMLDRVLSAAASGIGNK